MKRCRPCWRLARRLQRRLARETRGTSTVELAFAAPILVAIALGGVEITRFVLLNQKIERTSATMADLVSQSETLTEQNMNQLFEATTSVMTPFEMNSGGTVIVSSVSNTGSGAEIDWQRAYGVAGNTSQIGMPGAGAQLPAGFVLAENDSVIVAEVIYSFAPMFTANLIDPVDLYNLAVFRPRFGALNTILP
jgi:Flp pilus assembly protein TadG